MLTERAVKGMVVGLHFFGLLACAHAANSDAPDARENWSGKQLIEDAIEKHHLYPYVFEKQSMILRDKMGNRTVYRLRRYSRLEKDGSVKLLLSFDQPAEIRGTALLAVRSEDSVNSWLYLPALGDRLISTQGHGGPSRFLGTDFTVSDLISESVDDYNYLRQKDQFIDKVRFFVVDAQPVNAEVEKRTGYSYQRHYIRADNMFITYTDYHDLHRRLVKRKSWHDLKRVNGDMWRGSMCLMEDVRMRHQTLVKVTDRVFSVDYVQPEIFTERWLLEKHHMLGEVAPRISREGKEKPSDQVRKAVGPGT